MGIVQFICSSGICGQLVGVITNLLLKWVGVIGPSSKIKHGLTEKTKTCCTYMN